MKRIAAFLLISAALTVSPAFSQKNNKFGHINSAELLSLMPERKVAAAKMDTMTKEIQKQMEDMMAEYRSKQDGLEKGKTTLSALVLKDKELAEGYSNFNKKELKDYLNLLNKIITDTKKLAHNAKVTRAPRKKKAKPVDKIVSKLQYKKEDNEYKIVSINPVDVVGCSQLWVFNTKTRKLGVYNSKDADGLNVKGTTLINFDDTTSIHKTLRKPEVTLPEVIKSGKVSLKKLLPNINSVEQALTGRLNGDTILLRVIK
jgi:Skp family chaperone for outer membrane proteins